MPQDPTLPPSSPSLNQIIPAGTTANPSPQSPKKAGLIIGVILALIVFLTSGVSAGAYLIATDKIPLANQPLKDQITRIVFSMPFVPKTPLQVLRLASIAHKNIAKNSFDLSIAVTSGDFQDLLGSNNLDVSMVGFSDYTDPTDPKVSFTINITRDFSLDLRKKDKNLYLKVNKLPLFIYPILGLEPEKISPLLDNWLVIDTTPLETEARKSLDNLQKSDQVDSSDEALDSLFKQLVDEDILPNLKMTSETVDTTPIYKLVYAPTPEQLDAIIEKLSDYQPESAQNINLLGVSTAADDPKASDIVKNPILTIYIDQKSYFVTKTEVSLNLESLRENDSETSSPFADIPDKVTLVGVVKLSDFGHDVSIDIPESALTPDDFYQKFIDVSGFPGIIPQLSGSKNTPPTFFSKSNNTKRRSDVNALLNAIHQYGADNAGDLPQGITTDLARINHAEADMCSDLVPNYLAALPQDPQSNDGVAISDCTSNYDTGYTVTKSTINNQITVSAPLAELGEAISVTR